MTSQWPAHVAIIPDGNGRWASEQGLLRSTGHQRGATRVKELVEHLLTQPNITTLTIFGFSTENNKRPAAETRLIMSLIRSELNAMQQALLDNNIQLLCIGDRSQFPKKLLADIIRIEEKTAQNTGLTLVIALHYSGRWDITQATQKLAIQVENKKLIPSDITPEHINAQLQTHALPEPDLLIRTSGEQRISNFLLWPLAYTELYMTPCFWPDFNTEQFDLAIEWYQSRERRFGNVNPKRNHHD